MCLRKGKCRFLAVGMTLLTITFLAACSSTPPKSEKTSSSARSGPAKPGDLFTLADAMDKLQQAIEKPVSPFHLSLKKVQSDGFSYECEADVSSDGITSQQTSISPATRVGNDAFPARTDVKTLKGTPVGSLDWGIARTNIVMVYLNGHIEDGQPGVKYAGEEQTGGYDARRYDFDLSSVPASEKAGMLLGGNALGAIAGSERKLKDYNVKGSAWIAKDDGRMAKFVYDYTMVFSDGDSPSTHYEGAVSKK